MAKGIEIKKGMGTSQCGFLLLPNRGSFSFLYSQYLLPLEGQQPEEAGDQR